MCFVNYLREYLPPDWVEQEQVLRPFRKKGCDFKKLWNGEQKYLEAFKKIRSMMAESVVIHHVGHVAAAKRQEAVRPESYVADLIS